VCILFCLLNINDEWKKTKEKKYVKVNAHQKRYLPRQILPLPSGGVGAERSIKVLMLAVCAMPVCTGVCASVRFALVGDEGVSIVSVAGTG
jgi:hypothetical protein